MNDSHADRPSSPRPSTSVSPATKPRDRQLPRYKVILHHHPTIDLMVIVRSVMELTRFARAEATHRMWEAHHHGRSVVLTTWLERAELYVEQFTSKGLVTTIEPC